ncbi:MAG: aminotransferase class I/II-fold pyridoxal phosphate-dependent enzyme [Eudoraea sp.]
MIISLDSFPGRKIKYHSKKHLYFGGTSYLGMQTDSTFQKKYIANFKKYGTNYGASRIANIQITIYEQIEKYLANWTGSEKTIITSSGYLAGQLLITHFNAKDYRLFHAPGTHSALMQDKNTLYQSYEELKNSLNDFLEMNTKVTPVVFLDSIDFIGKNYPDFKGLRQLPLQECIVVADDSHGIGILGTEGEGVYRLLLSLQPKELLVCCSLSKSLGLDGGLIMASETRVDRLKATEFYAGASPPSPASMATLADCKNLYIKKREYLLELIRMFIDGLKYPQKFVYLKRFPVFSFSDDKLTAYLLKHHILITDFDYPSGDNLLKSRIVISAAHKKKDIQKLTTCINAYFQDKKIY